MRKIQIGDVFGRLIIVSGENTTEPECRCVCGNVLNVSRSKLVGGRKSCGCLVAKKSPRKRKGKGGLTPKQIRDNPETHRRNKLQHEAFVELGKLRKQASREWNTFFSQWSAKWSSVTQRSTARKKGQKRRADLIRTSKLRRDPALDFQLALIAAGPCKCFWCGKFLPNGGTADHIISLAKKGRHTSDNVCAACPDCNSSKTDQHHTQTAQTLALF